MRTLLTVVGDGTASSVLETALLAARKFDGRVIGLNALTTEYAVVFGGEMGFSVSSEVDRTLEREGHDRRMAARRLFEEFMRAHNVPISDGDVPAQGVSAEWREESGRQNAVVGSLGRVFDLIVVERPAKLASLAEATLEDALFESGRPVLMAPPVPPKTIGERIVIAWNGTETARTVGMSMPYLALAGSVDVVWLDGGMQPGPSGDDLAAALRRRGIAARARLVPLGGRQAGEVFLSEARSLNCDLLVKGAYTQSRLRQMIFGGATRHIIMEADIPVILAH
jgi:nucleotide-binding universal stress UspA family protein